MDQILEKFGLKYEDLNAEERNTLKLWIDGINKSQITIGTVKEYVTRMREAVAKELGTIKETPQTWQGILGMFIPFVGLLRKWYSDQHELMLKARLKNYIMLEELLSTPDRANKMLESVLSGIKPNKK